MISWEVTAVAIPMSQGGCGGELAAVFSVDCVVWLSVMTVEIELGVREKREETPKDRAWQECGQYRAQVERWHSTKKDSFIIWIVFNWKEHTDSPVESPASCTLSPQKKPRRTKPSLNYQSKHGQSFHFPLCNGAHFLFMAG